MELTPAQILASEAQLLAGELRTRSFTSAELDIIYPERVVVRAQMFAQVATLHQLRPRNRAERRKGIVL